MKKTFDQSVKDITSSDIATIEKLKLQLEQYRQSNLELRNIIDHQYKAISSYAANEKTIINFLFDWRIAGRDTNLKSIWKN